MNELQVGMWVRLNGTGETGRVDRLYTWKGGHGGTSKYRNPVVYKVKVFVPSAPPEKRARYLVPAAVTPVSDLETLALAWEDA